jgi:hypothetical protein
MFLKTLTPICNRINNKIGIKSEKGKGRNSTEEIPIASAKLSFKNNLSVNKNRFMIFKNFYFQFFYSFSIHILIEKSPAIFFI